MQIRKQFHIGILKYYNYNSGLMMLPRKVLTLYNSNQLKRPM